VYALTTGQFSSLTPPGWKGPSTPRGSFEIPFNPISLMIEVGATFVARSYSGDIKHLTETFVKAIEHEGFSFIEVIQPAMPYHKWEEYKDKIELLKKEPKSKEEAIKTAHNAHRFTIGIFHQEIREVYHRSLYGEFNPVKNSISRKIRIEKIRDILNP
jgi:2-oxoglutarate ferredoxin oxidoreductase subunit beta